MTQIIKPFVAGYLATLIFHQGVWAGLYAAGKVPAAAWDMSSTEPFGIPAVLSLAFWGGLWGIALWPLIKQGRFWLKSIVLGAVGPSALALLVVFPLKGLAIAGGWDPKVIVGALILNAAWGQGLGLGLRILRA
jgi:hypothetical protein